MPQVQGTMMSLFNKKVNSHSFKLFPIITDESLTLSNVGEPIEKKVFLSLLTSSTKREITYFHVVVVQLWQRNVDNTMKCTCKVIDLLIKLTDWPVQLVPNTWKIMPGQCLVH